MKHLKTFDHFINESVTADSEVHPDLSDIAVISEIRKKLPSKYSDIVSYKIGAGAVEVSFGARLTGFPPDTKIIKWDKLGKVPRSQDNWIHVSTVAVINFKENTIISYILSDEFDPITTAEVEKEHPKMVSRYTYTNFGDLVKKLKDAFMQGDKQYTEQIKSQS